MSIWTLNSITKQKLLLGEGVEDVNFLQGLLRHLNREDIQVAEFGGKSKLDSFLRTLPVLPGFSSVISIGITRDADYLSRQKSQKSNAAKSAFDSVCSLLLGAKLPRPKQVGEIETGSFQGRDLQIGVFVFPDGQDSGMLEDLCLQSVKADSAIDCLEEFFDCVSNRSGRRPTQKDRAKARIHAWLATQSNPELRLGEAALQTPPIWNWDSPVFEPIKTFVRTL